MKKGSTVLWEGIANKLGSADNSGNNYTFKDTTMDVSNYDYILIEYAQFPDSLFYSSTLISKNTINKSITHNLGVYGYGTRLTSFHFVDNGFVVDNFYKDSSNNSRYLYITKITGMNI